MKKKINLFVCGPTVYDHLHIGNIRPLIMFDLLVRFLSLKNKVNYLSNITDIDDKVIVKAAKLGVSEKELTTKYTKEYLELISKLNVIKPHFIKVTENILGITNFIKQLLTLGYAYKIENDVYFDTTKVKDYGKRINLEPSKLINDKNELNYKVKKSPQDFVLWKTNTKGIKFSSSLGKGRPGWHTECAFFIYKFFKGQTLDIHGGGIDLRFPHHLNEEVQYKVITGHELTKKWMYVGHINYKNWKMSKSKGNLIYAKDYLANYSANNLRLLFYQVHYAKPFIFTTNLIKQTENEINKINAAFLKASIKLETINFKKINIDESLNSLANDLSVSGILTTINNLIKKISVLKDKIKLSKEVNQLYSILFFLGFKINLDKLKFKKFIEAYKAKKYHLSDKLREEIFYL